MMTDRIMEALDIIAVMFLVLSLLLIVVELCWRMDNDYAMSQYKAKHRDEIALTAPLIVLLVTAGWVFARVVLS